MPWPTAPDRLSPSGPFLPVGGPGIIQAVGDCTEEPQELESNVPFLVIRNTTPGELVALPLSGYTPGNPILIQQTYSILTEPEEDDTGVFIVAPVLNIDGDLFAVNNAAATRSLYGIGADLPLEPHLSMHTEQMLFLPDPELITADPVIGFLGVYAGAIGVTLQGGPFILPEFAGSPAVCSFTAIEIDARAVPQVCRTSLDPIATP